jgi:hypothetical protein
MWRAMAGGDLDDRVDDLDDEADALLRDEQRRADRHGWAMRAVVGACVVLVAVYGVVSGEFHTAAELAAVVLACVSWLRRRE